MFTRARARLRSLSLRASSFATEVVAHAVGRALQREADAARARWHTEMEADGWITMQPRFNGGPMIVDATGGPMIVDATEPVDFGSFHNGRAKGEVLELVDRLPYAPLAKAWQAEPSNLPARAIAQLPVMDDGDPWRFAAPIMHRELLLVQYAIIYILGLNPWEAERLAKRVINEWHGFEPLLGLEDNTNDPPPAA
jgi:hypothetical protein